jgi:23S rRNA (adenine-C8)-methyltransferase
MESRYQKIQQIIFSLKEPDYRYLQITKAIFKQRIGEFERMTILPGILRDALINEFGYTVPGIKPVLEKASNQVSKVLFAIDGGNDIEAVRLSYKRGWESFCISSQCGCGFGCCFCATGAIGLKRNLTTDEITDQLLYFLLNGHVLNSVSFMGMGDALANPHIFDALAILTDPHLFGLSQRRITISTIGILPGINKLTQDFPQVNLAFSLHSPFNAQRSELMPINDRFPLHDVLEALDNHIRHTGRMVYIAYILLQGINDSPEHAKAVAELLRGRGLGEHLYHVDLIPYNPTDKTLQRYSQSRRSRVNRFYQILRSSGINVTTRTQFGSDIGAACGQLYGSEESS